MSHHFLCKQQEIIEGNPRDFSLELESGKFELFLVKHDGIIYAYKNQCPHLGIPLNWQPGEFLSLELTHIQCSTHGALFNLDNGYCILGPCAGESLTSLTVEQRDDELWLQLDSLIPITEKVA
ncbi:MAG: Rieske (2Fe-2S) protein [Methylophaga sp.]|nr:Rieske (2Fe-2S) protein [Methylophaga sp.]